MTLFCDERMPSYRVFVDGAYVWSACNSRGPDVQRLLSYFFDPSDTITAVTLVDGNPATYLSQVSPDSSAQDSDIFKHRNRWHDRLKESGVSVRTVDFKRQNGNWTQCGADVFIGALATWSVAQGDNVCVMTGDSDFASALKFLQSHAGARGSQLSVIGFDGSFSRELRALRGDGFLIQTITQAQLTSIHHDILPAGVWSRLNGQQGFACGRNFPAPPVDPSLQAAAAAHRLAPTHHNTTMPSSSAMQTHVPQAPMACAALDPSLLGMVAPAATPMGAIGAARRSDVAAGGGHGAARGDDRALVPSGPPRHGIMSAARPPPVGELRFISTFGSVGLVPPLPQTIPPSAAVHQALLQRVASATARIMVSDAGMRVSPAAWVVEVPPGCVADIVCSSISSATTYKHAEVSWIVIYAVDIKARPDLLDRSLVLTPDRLPNPPLGALQAPRGGELSNVDAAMRSFDAVAGENVHGAPLTVVRIVGSDPSLRVHESDLRVGQQCVSVQSENATLLLMYHESFARRVHV